MRILKIWLIAACYALANTATAANDALDQSVSLRTEADLVRAVTLTLQHAIATSERYRGASPRVQKFARSEISKRRQRVRQLGRSSSAPIRNQHLAIVPTDERSYLQAMQRNHARLIELIEHGISLPMSRSTKKIMESLMRGAITELALLGKLESS